MNTDRPIISIKHAKATVEAGIRSILSLGGSMAAPVADHARSQVFITDFAGGLAAVWDRRARAAVFPKIVVVTDRVKEWDLRVALDSGVNAILAENCNARELEDAVVEVCAGRGYLSASIADRARASLRLSHLTYRERQVLQMIGKGLCNKSIARTLGIAEVTAKRHLQHMMNKLGAQTRTQAVVIGCARGIIDVDEAEYAAS